MPCRCLAQEGETGSGEDGAKLVSSITQFPGRAGRSHRRTSCIDPAKGPRSARPMLMAEQDDSHVPAGILPEEHCGSRGPGLLKLGREGSVVHKRGLQTSPNVKA